MGYTVKIDKESCLSSGRCVAVAPRGFGFDDDQLADKAREVARTFTTKIPRVVRAAKECLNNIDPVDVNRSYRFEQGFTFELNLAGVADEARDAFVDKRDPDTDDK